MYNVLFVCLYVLGTKHDIFQINMSLIRQISRFRDALQKNPRLRDLAEKIWDAETEKAPSKRDFETTQKPPRFRDHTKIFRNPRF